MHLSAERTDRGLDIRLTGEWRASALPALLRAVDAVEFGDAREVRVTSERVESIDSSGAWAVRRLVQRAETAGVDVRVEGRAGELVELIDTSLAAGQPAANDEAGEPGRARFFDRVGRKVVDHGRGAIEGLEFTGRVSVTAARVLGSVKRLRITSITRHVYETGITAIPIVSLIAFLISVIIAYMSATQLEDLGAEIFVVDLVTIGVLRELGVLLTAIIVAGRSGSAFAAEIGSMKLNEEVDALTATGVDPLEVLVLPRMIGLVIALPLLTIIADGVGLLGGALLCVSLLDMPLTQFFTRAQDAIAPTTFWVGIIKAPVFAMLIAIAGTYRGLQVRGSARELGRLTTVAVVQSIFLVILADAIFAVLFLELDI